MIEWIVEPWSYPFMRWALACCLVLAGIHAYLGFHVVRRGVLFVDLSMAQMAALGAAVGIVIGLEHGTVAKYLLSAVFAFSTAGLIAVLRSRKIPQEAIIATIYGLATAATFVVLEHAPHGMEEIKYLLVGQVLTVPPDKVWMTALLYAPIGLLLYWLHSRTMEVTEDGEASHRMLLDFIFYGAFAVVITSSVGLVGVLLVFALLVLPAVSAILLSNRSTSRLAWGWGIAGAGSLIGLHAAFDLDLPAAPVIVLTLGALLLVAAILGRLRRA
jgi:zinc/manganese transport system permease protein